MACGDPGSAKCARTWTASTTGVIALSESLLEPLVAGDQKASLASPSVALPIQALRGLPCLGFYSTDQALKGALGGVLLSSSVVRRLMGQPLYFQLPVLACGGREAVVMAPPTTCDSAALPCFRGCLAFFHRDFPSQPPPSHPLNLSLRSQQQPSAWDQAILPKLQLPGESDSHSI